MLCYVAKIDLTVLICVFVVACIEETLFNVEYSTYFCHLRPWGLCRGTHRPLLWVTRLILANSGHPNGKIEQKMLYGADVHIALVQGTTGTYSSRS